MRRIPAQRKKKTRKKTTTTAATRSMRKEHVKLRQLAGKKDPKIPGKKTKVGQTGLKWSRGEKRTWGSSRGRVEGGGPPL